MDNNVQNIKQIDLSNIKFVSLGLEDCFIDSPHIKQKSKFVKLLKDENILKLPVLGFYNNEYYILDGTKIINHYIKTGNSNIYCIVKDFDDLNVMLSFRIGLNQSWNYLHEPNIAIHFKDIPNEYLDKYTFFFDDEIEWLKKLNLYDWGKVKAKNYRHSKKTKTLF